jgi:hypothetical protein
MANKSEANGQNSENDPSARRSGAHIEKMMKERYDKTAPLEPTTDKLRPSEQYTPPLDKAEGDRGSGEEFHRRTPEDRER